MVFCKIRKCPQNVVESLPCRIDNSLIEKSMKLFRQRENDESVENQIDQLVYQLYDLTEEEIKIIENN
jgi:adenine-specific DNA-methyltransferase